MRHRLSDGDLRKEYGPDAVFTRIGDVLIVHQDKPTKAMIRQRIAEVQREAREPVDDCPLCEDMRRQAGRPRRRLHRRLPRQSPAGRKLISKISHPFTDTGRS